MSSRAGVAGIAAHWIGTQRGHKLRTILTDQAKLVPLISRNIAANLHPTTTSRTVAAPAPEASQTKQTLTSIGHRESVPPLPAASSGGTVIARELKW